LHGCGTRLANLAHPFELDQRKHLSGFKSKHVASGFAHAEHDLAQYLGIGMPLMT